MILLALRFFGEVVAIVWPFLIIIPGVAMFAFATTVGWQSRQLAAAGAVVAGTGVILLVQEMTDYYQSWAYAWTLLPVFAGVGLLFVAQAEGNQAGKTRALQLMRWGALAFLVAGVAFETLIFRNPVEGSLALPLILIAAGALLLVRRTGGPWTGSGSSGDLRAPPPPAAAH